jgi:hypothetical protein
LAGRKLHLTYQQPSLLYRNMNGVRFEDVSSRAGAAVQVPRLGRGCAFGDLDNDGDIDIVINNLDSAPTILRNEGGNRANWLQVKCIGTKSNRSAIGARISVRIGDRRLVDEVMSGGSYYSHNDLKLHFGLGSAKKADAVEVTWPSGLKTAIRNIDANQSITIEEKPSV